MALSTPAVTSKAVGIGQGGVFHCDPTGVIFPSAVRPSPIVGLIAVAPFSLAPLLVGIAATDGARAFSGKPLGRANRLAPHSSIEHFTSRRWISSDEFANRNCFSRSQPSTFITLVRPGSGSCFTGHDPQG